MGKIETPDDAARGIFNVSRRNLLKGTGGLALGFFLAPLMRGGEALAATASQPFGPNAFVRIDSDGMVTVLAKHLEMGQGSYTGLATLLAEELDADWDKVRVEGAPADVKLYNNNAFGPMQGTGGSTAMANSWEQMRNAGATAKAMLVGAAAQRWQVPASEISVSQGVVSHAGSERKAGFGELVEAAAQLPVPQQVQLKDPKDFKLIGKVELRRKDSRDKTDGRAVFTQDFKLPGMLVAMVAYPPRFGGVPRSVDASKAKAVRDVVDVVELGDLPHGRSGVAVLAKNTWAARQGRDALVIDWDESNAFTLGSEEILAQYRESAGKPGLPATSKGDADAALAKAAKTVEAVYEFPYLAHAAMEPMNCLVKLSDDRCEIWNGEQFQTVDQAIIGGYLGLPPEKVSLTQLYAGGSFGRRASSQSDYLVEAVAITRAARAKGHDVPVKMVWTREDDTRAGFFRPMYLHRVRIGVDEAGNLLAWHNRLVGQSIMAGTTMEAFIKDGVDHTSVEGVSNLSYAVPNLQVELSTPTNIKVPVLWWRSVGHTHTGYVAETMIDEAAVAAGKDPYAFRDALLDKHPRHRGVLKLAAEQAGWGKPLAPGVEGEKRGRGIAVHESFGSFVAQVAEVTVKADGSYRLDRVVCAVDCGIAINPDVIRAQMEGGIGFALSAARHSAITLKDGRVEQSNFHDFQVLRMNDMPKVEVHIVPSGENPSGVGEPGVPPLAPALANALFAATGVRLRRLPFPAKVTA